MLSVTDNRNALLAIIINVLEFPAGMKFWGDSDCPLQFGSCMYNAGVTLKPHVHKTRARIPDHKTIEFLYIIRGNILATFYSVDRKKVREYTLVTGDCVMLYDGGHGFKVLTDDTAFIEVKNGPYISVDADKTRFDDLEM